ncbi:MAG: glycosyltransferase [Bacillota bacterium]|nr:glycosyltransferase [Bacillota bacterium]
MICAVIPVQNEEAGVGRVLDQVLAQPVDLVIPVLNGSSDRSPEIIRNYAADPRIAPLVFPVPLGLDIPRAVGAARARALKASAVLFVDGDMSGEVGPALRNLLGAVTRGGLDLALTDCYPPDAAGPSSPLARTLLDVRRLLNRALGLPGLGGASPCHGPHAVSARFLETVPLEALSVPPVALVRSALAGLAVGVAASLPHAALGSPDRGEDHALRLAETIIGDHLEAFCVLSGKKNRSRVLRGLTFDGYDSERRRDLLF